MENEIMKFLLGEGPLDGIWFGDKHPIERGAFWWRKHLRQYITQNQPNSSNTLLCGEGAKEIKYIQHNDPETRTTSIQVLPYPPNEQLATEALDTVAEREQIKKAFDWLTPEKAARLTKPIKWDAGSSHEEQP